MQKLIILLIMLSQPAFSQKLQWENIETKTEASFRGLSVVNDKIAWVSGSKGYVGQTTNGGKDWTFKQIQDFEKYDFRSLYAFDANTAIIANAGSPARILRTSDAGLSWKVVYTNEDTSVFIDGIDFWNDKEGIIYGDPMGGRMLVLRTFDGGLTWQELPEMNRPVLATGEASFAASGTTIRCMGTKKVMIATGGKISRLLVSDNQGANWKTIKTPIMQGQSSTGIFSLAYRDENNMIIVGGDYKRDTLAQDHVFYTTDGGKTWSAPAVPTGGYRECVEFINKDTVIATGPRGTDISYNGGINWIPFSGEQSFHVLRKARKGSLIIAAGGKGKLSLLK